jgi:hypothetical protein
VGIFLLVYKADVRKLFDHIEDIMFLWAKEKKIRTKTSEDID